MAGFPTTSQALISLLRYESGDLLEFWRPWLSEHLQRVRFSLYQMY